MSVTQPDRLDRIETLIEGNAKAIAQLEKTVETWEERFLSLSRDNLVTSRTIIITAGTVVILFPVL